MNTEELEKELALREKIRKALKTKAVDCPEREQTIEFLLSRF